MRAIERWKRIPDFPDYSVSDHGNVRSERTGRNLALNENQYGLLQVGMMKGGEQFHRSVPLLVANAFMPMFSEYFDTPINLDGDRHNNYVDNLVWRPRWFAVKYNRQFKHPYYNPIPVPLEDVKTGEVSADSRQCFQRYGLLEEDLVLSILNRTFVWPTYQEFRMYED